MDEDSLKRETKARLIQICVNRQHTIDYLQSQKRTLIGEVNRLQERLTYFRYNLWRAKDWIRQAVRTFGDLNYEDFTFFYEKNPTPPRG